jgi:hypothetical protein
MKEHLLKMTPEERGLFLLLGYASNQVNVLWKLVIEMTNRSPTDPVDGKVSSAQTQIMVRLTIGVLREAWRLIETRLLSSKLRKEYVPLLDPTAEKALEDLKRRFRGDNALLCVIALRSRGKAIEKKGADDDGNNEQSLARIHFNQRGIRAGRSKATGFFSFFEQGPRLLLIPFRFPTPDRARFFPKSFE